MKQKILMLLAAVLLGSVSAIAQSGNNEPLKGDVNEDGVVDVADIAAIIEIMANGGGTSGETFYWYAGQNPDDNYITSSNYTSIATQSEFTTKTINMTVGNYLYVVVPSDKTVKIADPQGNVVTMNFYNESRGEYAKTPNVEVNGCYLIRSRATTAAAEAWTITLSDNPDEETTYYWYVGHENPVNMTSITPLSSTAASAGAGWRTIGATLPTYSKTNPLWHASNQIVTATSKSTMYVALPSDNIKSRNDITGDDVTGDGWTINSTKKTLGGVQYTIWTSIAGKKSFSETLY